jgi:glycine oxidase
VEGLTVASGHFRNGILLAPVTGDEIARLVVDGNADPSSPPFTPER